MAANHDAIEYGPAPEPLRAQALSLLLSQEPEEEKAGRLQEVAMAIQEDKSALDTLLTARRGTILMGSVWGRLLPGHTCVVWPARVINSEYGEVADQLQQYLDQQLVASGMQIAQAMLSDVENDDARRLLRCGYKHAADLLYLVSMLGKQRTETPDTALDFERYAPSQRRRLADLVEATYAESLDIPLLDGKRDMEYVLDGYEQTGVFSPDRWLLVRAAGRDVGCLLLADHPASQQWELVYMGIVPAARGKGWGAAVTAKAQELAREAGRERLVLAVDSHNDPAIAAYTKAGFVEWFRRSVLLKSFVG